MASAARRTRLIRKRKRTAQGKKRKAKVATNGTTKSKKELFAD